MSGLLQFALFTHKWLLYPARLRTICCLVGIALYIYSLLKLRNRIDEASAALWPSWTRLRFTPRHSSFEKSQAWSQSPPSNKICSESILEQKAINTTTGSVSGIHEHNAIYEVQMSHAFLCSNVIRNPLRLVRATLPHPKSTNQLMDCINVDLIYLRHLLGMTAR